MTVISHPFQARAGNRRTAGGAGGVTIVALLYTPLTVQSRLAKIVSILFHPLLTAGYLLLVAIALDATSFWSGARWAALILLLAIGGPAVDLWVAVRARRVDDYHLMLREQRPRVLAVSLAFEALALAIVLAADGPRSLEVALMVGFVNGVAVTLITLGWKISIHVAAMTGALAVLWWRLGPGAAALVPLVLLVAWARLALRRHTFAQVLAAAAVAAVLSALVIRGVVVLL